jgi:hypothetical protein
MNVENKFLKRWKIWFCSYFNTKYSIVQCVYVWLGYRNHYINIWVIILHDFLFVQTYFTCTLQKFTIKNRLEKLLIF